MPSISKKRLIAGAVEINKAPAAEKEVYTTSFFFFNAGAAHPEKGQPDRTDTPWFLSIPLLQVVLKVEDINGNPVTGYVQREVMEDFARRTWSHLQANPQLLAELRSKPLSEWPGNVQAGYRFQHLLVAVS